MATRTPARPGLSDEQLAEMMGLLRGSDTVELKVTVPAAQQRDAIRALGLDALDAQIRQVVFYDTPDLALDRAGVVVRTRRIQGRMGDTVVKLRPLDPTKVERRRPAAQRIRGRGRRDPRRLRLLGAAQVRRGLRRDPPRAARRARPAQALHQGAACPVQGPRSRRARAGRPRGARADLRAQAEMAAARLRPQDGGGDVALPGRRPASSSSRPSACHRRRSRSRPRRASSSAGTGSTSPASSRPRRAPRWSSSRASSPPAERR